MQSKNRNVQYMKQLEEYESKIKFLEERNLFHE